MNELHRLGPLLRDRVGQAVAAAGGKLPLLVHPFDYGINENEWLENRRFTTEAIGGNESVLIPRETMIAQDQAYEGRLKQFLAECLVPFGIVFESVAIDHHLGTVSHRLQAHIAHLEQFDPVARRGDRTWIVVPTIWGNVLPLLGIERFIETVTEPKLKSAVEEAANLGLEKFIRRLVPLGLRQAAEDAARLCLQEALQTMAQLGVRYPMIGGCFLNMCGEIFVPSDYEYSCINHLGEKMYGSGLFETVDVSAHGTYIVDIEKAGARSSS